MGEKPQVLVVGPDPAWDLAPMADADRLHRPREAPDRDAGLQAVATRRELGASRALMKTLPRLEIVAC